MNSKALVLAAATTGVAVVTLVALNLVAPITHAQEAQAEGITAEQVFSASISEPGASSPAGTAFQQEGRVEVATAQDAGAATAPEAASSTPPPEAAPVTSEAPQTPAVAGGSCAMGAGGGAPVVVPATGAPGPSSEPAPAMEVAQADAAPAPEAAPPAEAAPAPETAPPPAPEPAAAPVDAAPAAASAPAAAPAGGGVTEAAGACPTGLTDPNAKPVVVVAGGAPGGPATPPPGDAGMAPPAPAEVAAVDPGAAAPAAEPPPPPPAPEPAAAPAAPEPKPEPAAAAPAPKPKPKPKAESKPAAPKKAPPEAKVAWWPAKEAGKLNIVYAGEASFTKAIAVMLDGQFDNADSANQNIKVTPKKGGEVKGKWLVAKGNPSMLLLDVAPGLYTVEIGTGLTDKGGRAVGAASSGAVFVH